MPRKKNMEVKFEGVASLLQPEVYRDGNEFICALKADLNKSAVGRGKTIFAAINHWNELLRVHLRKAGTYDPLVVFVKDIFGAPAPNARTRQYIIDWENQFYSPNRRAV
ncbi:hypothetical protein ACJVDH_13325 [Pedobacter sp. AW1-32]|uniref:hypothetical protein n=1 Tax=Pedobacter sp. AW1-32 TaxID=3383026 RepID=UPI003FEEDDC2